MGSPLKYDHIHGLDGDCRGCDWGRFRRAIEDSWSAETSVDPNWSLANPSLGQCAVTALLVQDARGGELVRTTVGGVSHYFNRLPSGVEIDLTRQQFADWEPSGFEVRDRSYVMGFASTVRRYEKLAQAVVRRLAGGR